MPENVISMWEHRFMPVVAFMCVIATSCDAQQFWKQMHGPITTQETGSFETAAILETGSGMLFAGTADGVFRSSDEGDHWRKSSLGITVPRILCMAEDSAGVLFAGSYGGGVYRSTDQGAEWSEANEGIRNIGYDRKNIHSFASDSRRGFLYAGSDSTVVYRSSDGGQSWHASKLAPASVVHVRAMFVTRNGNVFASTQWYTYRSTDHGEHWWVAPAAVNADGFAEGADSALYKGGSGIAKSTDHGDSWQAIDTGLPQAPVWSLAINSRGQLFAGYEYEGIWRSTDGGASWSAQMNFGGNDPVQTITITSRDSIFVGSWHGIYRSGDDGITWKQVTYGLGYANVQTLFSATCGWIFAGTDAGLYRSTDAGASWEFVHEGLQHNYVSAMDEDDAGRLYAATFWGLHVSSDSGSHWKHITASLGRTKDVEEVAVDRRGTILMCINGEGPMRSTDHGTTWENTNEGIVTPGYPSYRLIIAGQDSVFMSIRGAGVFLSTNHGSEWQRRNTGLTNTDVFDFARGPKGELYAGTAGGIFASTDQGENWVKLELGVAAQAVISLAVNNTGDVYAGMGGSPPKTYGIRRSTDRGGTWHVVNAGLGNAVVECVSIDRQGYAWLGTRSDGVFRSDGITVPVEHPRTMALQQMTLSQNYPNPFSSTCAIQFTIPDDALIVLRVADLYGREVTQLISDRCVKGAHTAFFNGSQIPAGTYLCHLEMGNTLLTRILTIVR